MEQHRNCYLVCNSALLLFCDKRSWPVAWHPSLQVHDGRQTADTMEQPERMEQHRNWVLIRNVIIICIVFPSLVALSSWPPFCPSLHVNDGRQISDIMDQPTRQERHRN